MATEARHQENTLTTLLNTPQGFEFFQAVRLLERLVPETKLQFKSHAALNYAHSPIENITQDKTNHSIALFLTFMGLTGQNGALPDHFTELLLERLHTKDNALTTFLDMFNQRLIQLFYQSWKKNRFYIAFEQQPDKLYQEKTLATLSALTGQSLKTKDDLITQDALIYYSGLLAHQTRSKESLKIMLCDYFQLPFKVHQFEGEWLPIKKNQTTQLAARNHHHNQLGIDTMAGQRVWHVQNRFEVEVGPLNYAQFCELLPNGSMLQSLKKMIDFYTGIELSYQIRLLLKSQAVPKCKLKAKKPFRLGWNSWLKTDLTLKEVATVTFSSEQLANQGSGFQTIKKEKILCQL